MTGKRKNTGDRKDTKTKVRKPMSMERKVEIIKRLGAGEKMADVARAFKVNWPSISTVYKGKDRILEHVKNVIPMTSMVITKRRGKCMEEMECLLTV